MSDIKSWLGWSGKKKRSDKKESDAIAALTNRRADVATWKERKKDWDAKIERYKSDKINRIIEWCEEFNLYNSRGIDWLISCRKEEIVSGDTRIPIISAYKSTALLICTLLYGALISRASDEILIRITSVTLCLLFMFVCLGIIIKGIAHPDNDQYIRLKKELEYIKIQYPDIPESPVWSVTPNKELAVMLRGMQCSRRILLMNA